MAGIKPLCTNLQLIVLIHMFVYCAAVKANVSKCEEITIPLCRNLSYNVTRFPNHLGHDDQEEAARNLLKFGPLVHINCSSVTRLFLCSLFAPSCTSTGRVISPCRSLCEQARNGCIRVMQMFGYNWPTNIKCELFPKKRNSLCIHKTQFNWVTVNLPTSAATSIPYNLSTTQTDKVRAAITTVKPTVVIDVKLSEPNLKCEKLTIGQCLNLGYNMTHFPNHLDHDDQDEAARKISEFTPLIDVGCSPVIRTFVCSLFAPVCASTGHVIVPCRSLCEQARKDCISLMKKFGYIWPSKMECELFPEKRNSLCLHKTQFNPVTVNLPTSAATSIPYNLSTNQTDEVRAVITTVKPTAVYNVKPSERNLKCKKLTIGKCFNLGYNMTHFPNHLNHDDQDEAAIKISEFTPLIDVGCSPVIRIFLCSLFAPVCTSTGHVIIPCRSLCEQARNDCISLMKEFGFNWPKKMKCELFPEKRNSLCIHKTQFNHHTSVTTSIPYNLNTSQTGHVRAAITTVKPTKKPQCEKITISVCQNLPYNMTSFPNHFLHKTQTEAALALNKFEPLLRINCSRVLKLFLCSIYAPTCNVDKRLPCRHVCKHVKRKCRKVLKRFGLRWHKEMKCRNFPKRKKVPSCLLN